LREARGPLELAVVKCYEPPTATVPFFLKDVGIITELARAAGCTLSVSESVAAL